MAPRSTPPWLSATQRLIVASMVLTSHEVLAALGDALDRGVALTGIYDGGQIFSTNAERNAENQIHLTNPATVNVYVDYLTTIIDAYR